MGKPVDVPPSLSMDSMTDRSELKEQDLLSRLELHSGYDFDDGVDCSLKLGFSDIHGKQSRVNVTPSQMLQNNGVMNGEYGYYYHNSYGAHMNLAGWRDRFVYQGGPSSFVDRAVSTCALNNSYARYQAIAMNNNAPLQSFHGYSRQCTVCGTTSTPLWRNGPRGAKTLCNACGIRFRKEERRANGNPGAKGSGMNGP